MNNLVQYSISNQKQIIIINNSLKFKYHETHNKYMPDSIFFLPD